MISRQLLCTTVVYQCQSVHSSLAAPSMRGIVTPGGGGLRSGSFHTNNIPSCCRVGQAAVRASFGVRLLYGTCLHRPSPPQRQSWNGHAISLPLTSPCERSPPMWRQYASSTLMSPSALRKMTIFCPKALTACGLPSPKSLIRPRQCQPRANLVGTARASMSRTSSASGCDIIGTIQPPRPGFVGGQQAYFWVRDRSIQSQTTPTAMTTTPAAYSSNPNAGETFTMPSALPLFSETSRYETTTTTTSRTTATLSPIRRPSAKADPDRLGHANNTVTAASRKTTNRPVPVAETSCARKVIPNRWMLTVANGRKIATTAMTSPPKTSNPAIEGFAAKPLTVAGPSDAISAPPR